MRAQSFIFALLATTVIATPSPSNADARQECGAGFTICAPPGATSETTPKIGDAQFKDLFVDIVNSNLPSSNSKRSPSLSARSSASLCCISSLSCLTMANLAIPLCYDKFTTNYFLPDNSYGTVVGGAYTASNGDVANLETGDYTLANGQTGNIYSNNPSEKPSTASLSIPSQYTASGVDPEITASGLSGAVTKTCIITLPGSTVPATTVQPTTISQTVSTGISISNSVVLSAVVV